MSLAREFGNYIGSAVGVFNIVRRSKPIIYRNVMEIISTIFAIIFINIIISQNIQHDRKKNIQSNPTDILVKRLMSIPIAIVIGWMIGFLAEMSVHSQLAQSRQNCLSRGLVENSREFNLCVDNTNFHLQNKGDLIHNLY
jgi:hypothetical protein